MAVFTNPENVSNALISRVFLGSVRVFSSVFHLFNNGLSICIAHAVNGIVVTSSREINVFTDFYETLHQSMLTVFDRDIKDLLN